MDPLKEIADFARRTSGLAFIGIVLIAAMWQADSVVKSLFQSGKSPFDGRGSRNFWIADRDYLSLFVSLFDQLYKVDGLYRPSIRRFIWVQPIIILVLAVSLSLIRPDLTHAAFRSNHLFLLMLNLCCTTLIINLLLDYFSVWKTRILISMFPQQSWSQLIIAPIDLFVTSMLFCVGANIFGILIAAWGVLFLDIPFNQMYTSNGLIGLLWLPRLLFFSYQYYICLDNNNLSAEQAGTLYTGSIMAISSMLAIVWSCMYAVSSVLTLASVRVFPAIAPVLDRLDFEGKPLRVNGAICGVILILLGVVSAVFQRLLS